MVSRIEPSIASDKLALTFENIRPNEPFGSVSVHVDDPEIKAQCYATDDFNPWYMYDSPFGTRIAPGGFFLRSGQMWEVFDAATDRGIMSKASMKLRGPVRIGDTVTSSSGFSAKFVKRGEPYYVLDQEVMDQEGTVVWNCRIVELISMRPELQLGAGGASGEVNTSDEPVIELLSERVDTHWDAQRPVVARWDDALPVGTGLRGLEKTIHFPQLLAFIGPRSPGEPGNMHVDANYAASVGLPEPIVPGVLTANYFSEFGVSVFGTAWLTGGELAIQFLQPVYTGETLSIGGAVGRPTVGDGQRSCNAWCTNREGLTTAVARLSVQDDAMSSTVFG